MRYRMISMLVLLVLLTAVVPATNAAPVVRHSGTVAAFDPERSVMILEEVGPWRVERGATVTTRLAITLTPATKYNLFMRVNAPDAFAGDFVEVLFDAGDVAPGDFVTVECLHEAGGMVALTVTVAELP